jgi:hypothetical protein
MNPVAVLRPNMRLSLIVVAFFALLMGVLVPLIRHLGPIGALPPDLMILVLSPWLLGILVLTIDRPSPVKFWAAPILLSLIAPALAVGHDGLIIRSWAHAGGPPHAMVTLLLNIALIVPFCFSVHHMSPRPCPDCGQRAMIPMMRPWGQGRGRGMTLIRWCGSCGARYGRIGGGPWTRERRTAWLGADGAPGASPSGRLGRRPDECHAPHRATTAGREGHPGRPTPA